MTLRLTILLLCSTLTGSAATNYLRADAAGTGGGTNWTDAFTNLAALETALARGDVGYVADGSYAKQTFNTALSGTTVITIKKATASDHGTDTGWTNTYGDGQAVFESDLVFATGHWVFDGNTRNESDWFSSSAYGFVIDDTDAVQIEGRGNYNVTNITVRHTYFQGRNYDMTGGNTSTPDQGWRGIYLQQFAPNGYYPNWTISRCYFQYGNVPIHARNAHGMTIEYCAFSENWSEQDNNHGENLSAYEANNHDFVIRYNQSRNMRGTAAWAVNNTTSNNWKVYGNLYVDCEYGDGFIGWQGGSQSGITIYNETIIRPVYALQCGLGSGNTVQNCIFMMGAVGAPSFQGTTPSYNTYSGSGSGSEAQTSFSTANFVDYAGGDFRLVTNTAAGLTLASPYDADLYGNTRGGSGQDWSRGYAQFTVASTSTNRVMQFNTLRIR